MNALNLIKSSALFFCLTGASQAGLWFKIPNAQDELTEYGHSSKSLLNPKSINVMVWNQYKGKERTWRREFERLSRNQDIMILQEATDDRKMTKVYDTSRDFQFFMGTSFIYRFGNKATGVVSAAKVEASDILAQRSRGVEIAGGTPKMILFASYPIAGSSEELLTVNIHALNSVTWQTLAAQLLDALKVVNAHQGPVVFGGDFNTWSKKKMEYMKHIMQKFSLEEVDFKNSHLKMKVFGRELDHVFTRGLKVKSASVEKSTGADHQPLFLTVEVR
ncbi:MAG: endonuclease/exonuclease/phosphatase family protein [bacterium]